MEKNNIHIDQIITRVTKVAGLILFSSLIVWGCVILFNGYHAEQTNDAQVEEYVNPVITRVNGYISHLNFEENQQVKKGDTLVTIDDSEYQIQQQEAQASLQSAKAQVDILQSTILTLQDASKESQSQITAAKVKLQRQQQEFSRYSNLLKGESATQQQFDNIKAGLDLAASEYQSTNHNYETALAKVGEAQAQKARILAEIKNAGAVLAQRNLNVKYTVITAPYDGRIGKKSIQDGQMVQAGQVLTYIINQDAGKWIIANFKETQVGYFHQGQAAVISVDAFPQVKFQGTIESMSQATGSRFSLLPPDNASGNFVKIIQRIPVRIRLTGPYEKISLLKAGMNADVSIKY